MSSLPMLPLPDHRHRLKTKQCPLGGLQSAKADPRPDQSFDPPVILLAEKSFGGCGVPPNEKTEVDRLTEAVHRAIQVSPLPRARANRVALSRRAGNSERRAFCLARFPWEGRIGAQLGKLRERLKPGGLKVFFQNHNALNL
jgi:hypothetical protein